MRLPDFSDATLIVLGHGSELDSQSSAPVYQHAAELRRRKLFAEVREAFWKQAPRVQEVLAGLKARRVFIVPLFMSEGYFSEGTIPLDLGFRVTGEKRFQRIRQDGDRQLFYCRPIGTHERMTEIIMARAKEVVTKFPFPREPIPAHTTLFLAGHGTGRDENSRSAVEEHVERIRSEKLVGDVQAIYLEESPRIGGCYVLARTKAIVIVPFFMSEGLHVRQDIPVQLGESERTVKKRLENGQPTWRNPTERYASRVWLSESVGTHPDVAGVILDRVSEAVEEGTMRKGDS